MIIKEGKIVYNNDTKINKIEIGRYEVYYKGLIFVSGEKCGKDSIEYLLHILAKDGVLPFNEIFGNYFIYIIDQKSQEQFIFSDNSGIFKAYDFKGVISTSFLELIDYFPEITVEQLDLNSVAEFLHFGFSYLEHTLVKDIKRISSKEYYFIQNETNQKKNKNIGSINDISQLDIQAFFSDLIYAINDKKTSIDLTGGFDSRLILSFFNKSKANFELALSGQENNKDIQIAQRISSKINNEFYPTFHSAKELSKKELLTLYCKSDSQIDIISYHRNSQLNNSRLSRNIELQISGVGGELYKDFWWMQDFPFYRSTKVNIEKLYNYRIESTNFPHKILGENLESYSKSLKAKTLSRLKRDFILKYNTQTYDNIYFNYKMNTNGGVYITVANNYFISYAPLLEFELVKSGFNLKRKDRFFNFFHRKWITRNSKEIATIKTTEGTSTSSLIFYMVSDLVFYTLDKIKRLLKQILRKVLNRTYFQENPTDNNIYNIVRETELFKNCILDLKGLKILNDNIDVRRIPTKLTGRILTLGMLVERIKRA